MKGAPGDTTDAVFILEYVIPYDGDEIIGVFATPEAAMRDRDLNWTEVVLPKSGEHYWTTNTDPNSSASFYLISSHEVRS